MSPKLHVLTYLLVGSIALALGPVASATAAHHPAVTTTLSGSLR